MAYNPKIHHRRSIRLPGYDYTHPGAYFVTICTHQRQCLFGEITHGTLHLNLAGEQVKALWLRLPLHFPNLELDEFVIMPNHVHGILQLSDHPINSDSTPQTPEPAGTQSRSIGAIIQNFKSVSTRRLRRYGNLAGQPIWQRNYYEHIIRNSEDLASIQTYIQNNPLCWQDDYLHPNH
jgi:REP element-mobilizing transposase RayT